MVLQKAVGTILKMAVSEIGGGSLANAGNWGCRISKYFCWAAALLSAQNGIEISYGSDAIL